MLIAHVGKRADSAGSFVAVIRRRAAIPTTFEADPPRFRHAQLWPRAAELLGDGGTRALLASAAALLGVRRVSVHRLLNEETHALGAPVTGVTLGMLSHQKVPAYLELRRETSEREVKRRLDDGAECVVAWRDGRIVAARWLRTDFAEITYLGAAVHLHPGVWYTFDAFTHPEERQQGISGMVTAAIMKRATNHCATALINAFVPENREGRGLARRRSQPIGTLRSVRLGPWRVVACRLPPGYLGAPMPLGSAI